MQECALVIIPTFWTATDGGEIGLGHNLKSEQLFLDSTLVSRAFENECVIAFCNNGGSAEEGYIGGSGVCVPFKGFIGKAKGCGEETVIVDVDMSIVEGTSLSFSSYSWLTWMQMLERFTAFALICLKW